MDSDIVERAVTDWFQLVQDVDSALGDVNSPIQSSAIREEYDNQTECKDNLDIDYLHPSEKTNFDGKKDEERNRIETKPRNNFQEVTTARVQRHRRHEDPMKRKDSR